MPHIIPYFCSNVTRQIFRCSYQEFGDFTLVLCCSSVGVRGLRPRNLGGAQGPAARAVNTHTHTAKLPRSSLINSVNGQAVLSYNRLKSPCSVPKTQTFCSPISLDNESAIQPGNSQVYHVAHQNHPAPTQTPSSQSGRPAVPPIARPPGPSHQSPKGHQQ